MASAQTKVNAAALPKSLNKTFEVTLTPPNLTTGGIISNPNLSRGVVHLRHWLQLSVTVNIANSNVSNTVVGGTASPNGALDYLNQIYYSSNTSEKFFVLTGAQAFKIGMWQMGVDASVNSNLNSIFANDAIKGATTATIAGSGNSNFTATYNIPINFSGTHTNSPAAIGFSTLNLAVKTFEINASFGTVASMLSGIAAGLTATITSAQLSVYSEFYPPNTSTVADSYEPPYYAGLALANTNTVTGATTKGSIGGIPKGSGYIYKTFFLFVDDTSTSPYYKPSDSLLTSFNLLYNTKNYLVNQLAASIAKAEAQLVGNSSIVAGMYPIPIVYQGNLNDVLNTELFSSFDLGFQTSAAAQLTLIGETVNANVTA